MVVSVEKYGSKWESSPNRGENKKYLKPPPSIGCEVSAFNKTPIGTIGLLKYLAIRWGPRVVPHLALDCGIVSSDD